MVAAVPQPPAPEPEVNARAQEVQALKEKIRQLELTMNKQDVAPKPPEGPAPIQNGSSTTEAVGQSSSSDESQCKVSLMALMDQLADQDAKDPDLRAMELSLAKSARETTTSEPQTGTPIKPSPKPKSRRPPGSGSPAPVDLQLG